MIVSSLEKGRDLNAAGNLLCTVSSTNLRELKPVERNALASARAEVKRSSVKQEPGPDQVLESGRVMSLPVEETLPAVAAGTGGIQGFDVSQSEDKVSPTKPTYQSLLSELRGLLDRVHAKSAGKPNDAITISPEILVSIDTVLTAVDDELNTTRGSVLHSPFVDLATRSATHFFIERSVRSFCEKVIDEVITEVGAGSGAFLLFQTSDTEARVMAARND